MIARIGVGTCIMFVLIHVIDVNSPYWCNHFGEQHRERRNRLLFKGNFYKIDLLLIFGAPGGRLSLVQMSGAARGASDVIDSHARRFGNSRSGTGHRRSQRKRIKTTKTMESMRQKTIWIRRRKTVVREC
jgi:hypothetical protein